MVIIYTIAFLLFNWTGYSEKPDRLDNEILLDTINYWHVRIDGEIELRANHYMDSSELLIRIKKTEIPEIVEIDYQTDYGFEYSVDRIVELKNERGKQLFKMIQHPKKYGEVTKIKIGDILERESEVSINFKWYYSKERYEAEDGYRKERLYKELSDPEVNKPFKVCKIVLIN